MDPNTKFLIDECLTPELTKIAIAEFGFPAVHVPWLGKPPHGQRSWKDPDIVTKVLENDFVLVTNNRRDFVRKFYREAEPEVHNGLVIILQKTEREDEKRLFRLVMQHIVVMADTVNKLIEIHPDGQIEVADWPDHNLDRPWQDPFR